MKPVFWIVFVPLAVIAVVFAIANRGPVTVNLAPLPILVDLPLYALGYLALLVGFVIGGLVGSAGLWRIKAESRAFARQAEAAQREIARLQDRLAARDMSPGMGASPAAGGPPSSHQPPALAAPTPPPSRPEAGR